MVEIWQSMTWVQRACCAGADQLVSAADDLGVLTTVDPCLCARVKEVGGFVAKGGSQSPLRSKNAAATLRRGLAARRPWVGPDVCQTVTSMYSILIFWYNDNIVVTTCIHGTSAQLV